MFKFSGIALVVMIGSFVGFIMTTETEGPKVETSAVDITYANDRSIPFGERLEKIVTDLFSDTTVQKTDRNITIDNMGEMYYLKMMQ